MSLKAWLCRWLCDCSTEVSQPTYPLALSRPRQLDEVISREIFMSKIDMALMEVDLPDATQAKNVDIQLLKIEFLDDIYKIFNQELVLARTDRSARYIVPEGSVYTLSLGYTDVQNDGSRQTSWGVPVQLTHQDELMPDAPGPFGAIRMLDEFEGDLGDGGTPDVPGNEPPADEPPAEEPPAEEPPADEPPAEDPVPDELVPGDDLGPPVDDSGSGGPIENLPQDGGQDPQGGSGSL